VGNVVGSNVFNVCLVIGTVGLFNPMSVDMSLMHFEFPAMFFLCLSLWIFGRTGFRLNRLEGLFFVVSFVLFVGLSYVLG
jgi:cation:H+ antiporter